MQLRPAIAPDWRQHTSIIVVGDCQEGSCGAARFYIQN